MPVTLNAFLTSPLPAGLDNHIKSEVLKIQGFKSRLTKEDETEPVWYLISPEMSLSNALITINVNKTTETKILVMANTFLLIKLQN